MASTAALASVDAPVHPLTAYRQRNGLTLAAFAAKVKPPTTQATISRIESGSRQPTLTLLRQIVEATGREVTANDIVDFHTR